MYLASIVQITQSIKDDIPSRLNVRIQTLMVFGLRVDYVYVLVVVLTTTLVLSRYNGK